MEGAKIQKKFEETVTPQGKIKDISQEASARERRSGSEQGSKQNFGNLEVKIECPVRHNFSSEMENLLNNHMHLELHLSHSSQAMWAFYGRDSMAAVGMSRLAEWKAFASARKAKQIASYIIYRGGSVDFKTIPKPEKLRWDNMLDALEDLVKHNKKAYTSLINLNETCGEDAHLADFIEDVLMDETIAWNKFLSDCLANTNSFGPSENWFPSFEFDRWLTRIVASKFTPAHVKSLSTKNLENKIPNKLFNADGDILSIIKNL